jgi:chromosome segregation ATPase
MGKIKEQAYGLLGEIETLEEELIELKETLNETELQLNEYKEVAKQLAKEVQQWEAYAEWIYSTYPEVEEGYTALQKVRG